MWRIRYVPVALDGIIQGRFLWVTYKERLNSESCHFGSSCPTVSIRNLPEGFVASFQSAGLSPERPLWSTSAT